MELKEEISPKNPTCLLEPDRHSVVAQTGERAAIRQRRPRGLFTGSRLA
jgi:hypothetical protein